MNLGELDFIPDDLSLEKITLSWYICREILPLPVIIVLFIVKTFSAIGGERRF